jgi:putative transposase
MVIAKSIWICGTAGNSAELIRVWRLMKRAGIKAQVGYRSPRARKGEASIVSPNRLQRQFNPDAPDERWVTDITYIRTHEGWLYLAVVVDLFSRKIIGWSMQSRMTKDIVLNALLMAVWRRNPKSRCWFIRIRAVSTQAMSGSRS